MKITLLTGGKDIHYVLNLLSGLIANEIEIDFIGNDEMEKASIIKSGKVHFYSLRGDQSYNAALKQKIKRILLYYLKLLKYAFFTDSQVFHIIWLNKFIFFDRIILNIYYKFLGKKIIYTAHDINYNRLIGNDNFINFFSLFWMYRIVDKIIVHTRQMKNQITEDFKIPKEKVSVIPFGLNDVLPQTNITSEDSKKFLKVENFQKTMLFFGNIAPYKGLEYLILALSKLIYKYNDLKLIIAGRVKINCGNYWKIIEDLIENKRLDKNIVKRIEFIPDREVEVYFKGADVLVLPYRNIFQSGLIFTAYRFGLPVIASDVGSLKDDIVPGKTGYVCKNDNPGDLAATIENYFQSDIYQNLKTARIELQAYASKKYSWKRSGKMTFYLYNQVAYL
jgi:glycosyltransferase involved in cell wall biosynthesis